MKAAHLTYVSRHLHCMALAAAALASVTLGSCSPYLYSDSSQTLSTKSGSLGTFYDAASKRIAAERRLNHRLEWVFTRPVLDFGPGCEVNATDLVACDLIEKGQVPTNATASTPATTPSKSVENICHIKIVGVGTPTRTTVKELRPLQRSDVFASLKAYTAALVAITKAQDRTDFDTAAGKVSAAVGGLVQSAALASGTAAPAAPLIGALAKASTDIALWLVGQALDYQRLEELRTASETACEPIDALAIALNFILEEQRGNELQELRRQLAWNIRTVNQLRVRGSAPNYGAAIDAAEASADAFQSIRATDPDTLANALRDTHDKLVLAVRNNTGERDALVASLTSFAKYVDQFETAASNVSASAATAAGKKP